MFVLEIIPFSRTAPPAPLSYRSRTDLPIGTIVSIPLRKKVVPGLVTQSIPVREAKSVLKTASFTLAKSSETVLGALPKEFITAAQNTATYHATTLGAVLSASLLPVLKDELTDSFATLQTESAQTLKYKMIRCEGSMVTRVAQYKKITTDTGATLLVVPTQTEADLWANFFSAQKPLVISGKLVGKRREAALAHVPTYSGILISTPNFAAGIACISGANLTHIILERVSAGSYSLPKRPYLDTRFLLNQIATQNYIPITYGDYPLPLEYRTDPRAAILHPAPTSIKIMDVRPKKTEVKEEKEVWHAIPDNIRSMIRDVLETNGRVAMLSVRRGYAPMVVCRDCSTTVTNEHGRTLSLATIKGSRVYRSSDGQTTPAAEVFCKVCGGWNLTPLGIGVERLEEELNAAFPNTPIIRIDQDSSKSNSLKKMHAEIMQPGVIILGTEIMLPYLSIFEPVDLGIIPSADSLLALPFWRARERFVRVGRMLAERSKLCVIATRHPEDTALRSLSDPNDTTFWQEETNLRKILSYPPFGTLIVFHVEGSAARIEEARQHIRKVCEPYVPHELSEQSIDSKGTLKASSVLLLPNNTWPDIALSQKLAHLSPLIRIHIDSEMLW
jgi:primosomal protein N'